MKKFREIFGAVLFFGIGSVLFVMISYMLRPITTDFGRQTFTGFYAEEEDSLDIVTLGGSAIFRYVNNLTLWEEFGWTSYNLGTPGQPLIVLENLVDEVKKTQNPKLMIVETRKFIIVEEKETVDNYEVSLRRVTDNMSYSMNRISLINKVVPNVEERLTHYFDIGFYHDNWETVNMGSIKEMTNKQYSKTKGWKNILLEKPKDRPANEGITEEEPISGYAEELLIDFMNKCREENIQVLFVATPWQISKDGQMKNNYLGRIIEENGFQFVDCNLYYDEMGLDFQTDFYNKKHTNVWGAQKVTRFLGNYIAEHYSIETTHSDKVAEQWDNAVKANNENVEKKKEIRAMKLAGANAVDVTSPDEEKETEEK